MIVPNRGVGTIGLSTDLNPYDLPTKAWTDAINVRFVDDKIEPYSSFKTIKEGMSLEGTPRGVFPHTTSGLVTVVSDNGTISAYRTSDGEVQHDLSPSPLLNTTNDNPTICDLAGLRFINSPQSTPIYAKESLNTPYEYIPNWDSSDSMRLMRSYRDFLVGFNVTKAANHYPTMVKWSDAAQYGAPPQNWSVTDDSSLAGENVLNEATGPILDAQSMGNSMMVYTERETFRMDYIGGQFIFRFTNISRDRGIIGTNCVVSVNGAHYVFGPDEIYVHDGSRKRSLSDRRIKNRIYGYMDFRLKQRCFVFHDDQHSEVIFAFPSVYREDSWSNDVVTGCNEAAVYNYKDDTWTMVQLPSVHSMASANITNVKDWDNIEGSWDENRSNWTSMEGRGVPSIVAGCGSNPQENFGNKLLALDEVLYASSTLKVEEGLVDRPFVERVYNDLEEITPDLSGRKLVRCIYPQIDIEGGEEGIEMSLGSARSPIDDTVWEPWRTFDPATMYKHDSRVNGRYIGLRIRFSEESFAQLSSLDFDVIRIARR